MQTVWDDKYLLGISELDEQHKNLMQRIVELELIQSNNKSTDYDKKVDEALTKINNYAVLHFSTEEVLMKMFEYELFESHKFSHDKFLHILTEHHKYIMELMEKQKQIKDNKFEFEDINQEINTRIAKVTAFLHKSLVHHMLKEDKEYAQFFIEIQKKAKKSNSWLSSLVG